MPTTLTASPELGLPLDPPRKQWTREECQRLERAGIFDQQTFELIEGELFNKMGKNRPHILTLVWMMKWLSEVFGMECVNPESPIDVSPEDRPTNEPQPDLIVFKQPSSHVQSGNPLPGDLHLVIEISDTSLYFDCTRKAGLYARAGIVEYWVLDVNGRRLIVHREPVGGTYQSIKQYSAQERVAPLGAPDRSLLVGDAFGGIK